MKFEIAVAWRYLRSPYKPAVLRLVTRLSVAGVAAGAATLVIALAMNSGFRRALEERLLGVTAHVNLTLPGGDGIRDYAAVCVRLRAEPGVRAAAPAVYQTVLLSAGGRARGLVLKGVDPAREAESNQALRRVRGMGRDSPVSADFSADTDGIDAVVLGHLLAQELKVAPGDYVTLTSPQGRLTPFGVVPRTRRFRVTAVFDSGFYDYDANWGFVTLAAARGMAGTGDLVNVIEVRLDDLNRAGECAPRLAARAGAGFASSTWMDQNRALFRALRLEKLVTAIFIGLITFVAGLNVLVVLAMTVTEKARDIAVLMALGARREQVRAIFLYQGLAVGSVGTTLGLALGYAAAWAADAWRLLPLDPEVYAVPYVPFAADWADALWITVASLAICAAATIFPARAAARMLPVEILRYE